MKDFKNIETEYDVRSIKCGELLLWPIIRIYIASNLILNKNRIIVNKNNILSLILNFFRGFYNLFFFNNGYLAFSDTDRRVLIDNKYYDRLVDPIGENLKLLILETPLYKHFPKGRCNSKYLTSRLPFFLIEDLLSYFILCRIENEKLLKEILNENNININYKKIVKKVIAQKILMNLFFKLKKIKGVFVVVSYTKTGLVLACKQNNIPVIELQHGVINDFHYAYNVPVRFDSKYYPDYILTYGDLELNVLCRKENYFIKNFKNVIPVGNFLIDYYRNAQLTPTEFENKTKHYDFAISITGQVAFDHLLVPFIIEVANRLNKVAFVFIPRGDNFFTKNNINYPQNIIFINSLNTYDIIRRSKIHCTVTSTCSIESLCLGVPNIFINIEGWSKKYYTNLEGQPFNYFADTPDEFIEFVNSLTSVKNERIYAYYTNYIKDNYSLRLRSALKDMNLN